MEKVKSSINGKTVWSQIDIDKDNKLYFECVAEKLAEENIYAKGKKNEDGSFVINARCEPSVAEVIIQESLILKSLVEDGYYTLKSHIKKSSKSLRKENKAIAVPRRKRKTAQEVNTEWISGYLSKFRLNLEIFYSTSERGEPDFYALNKGSLSFYNAIIEALTERKAVVVLILKNGRECHIRIVGKRFNLTEVMVANSKSPTFFDWVKVNFKEIDSVYCN